MERAEGQYKRYAGMITLIVGFIIASQFNVNTIQIFNTLKENSAKRSAMMAIVENYHGEVHGDSAAYEDRLESLEAEIAEAGREINSTLSLPPCSDEDKDCPEDEYPILGLLLTAIALSFGAPFWFDLLNKFMKLRSSLPVSSQSSNAKAQNKKGKKSINATEEEG